MMQIREEQAQDAVACRAIHDAAFGQPQEGRLVDSLRAECDDLLALVALEGEDIVGHIVFSPATIGQGEALRVGMGLAPLAVTPAKQGQGIGSALVKRGLELLHTRGCPFVIVLGHPTYYPRFGFVPAGALAIRCQWEGVPPEAFMIRILDPTAMQHIHGTVHYHPAFDALD